MRELKEVYEQFLQMEADRQLFDNLEICNLKIWGYIRYSVYGCIIELLCGVENPNTGLIQSDTSNTIANWIDNKIIKSQFRVKRKEVLIFNHPRRVKQGKYYKCVYTDEWLKDFNKSYYVYERNYAEPKHFKPVITKNLRYIDMNEYVKLFRKKYDLGVSNFHIQKVTDEVLKLLEEEFSICFARKHYKWLQELIKGVLWKHLTGRDYYRFLLEKIQPKVIIYVVGYSVENMIVAELGKELGIPTIELEHGHMGKEHLAYNFKANVKLNTFPDYLFVSGQHEVDNVRLPISKNNVYVIGSPELDKKVNYYNSALLGKNKKKKIITFISSGEKELIEIAKGMYERLNKDEYKIYFKLHPGEYKNKESKYSDLVKTGIEVVSDSKHDIYYYMAVSDYLIGIASTVLFEATRFNPEIMILRVGRYLSSESIVDTGNGVYIDSVEDAIYYIESPSKNKNRNDYFYCKNATQRLYNAIDDVMNRT